MIGIDPFFIAFVRLASAFAVFVFFYKKISFYKIIRLFLIGATQFGLMYFFYLKSYQYLKAYEVAVLTITTPIMIVCIHSLLERTISLTQILAALLSVMASGVVVYHSTEFNLAVKGVLYVQLSNFFFSLGQILYKKYFPHSRTESFAEFFWLVLGALVFISAVLVTQMLMLSKPVPISELNTTQWLVMIYLGSIATGIGFYMWNLGAKRVSTSQLAVLNNAKVPLAVLVSWLVFKENVQLLQVTVSIALFGTALYLSKK